MVDVFLLIENLKVMMEGMGIKAVLFCLCLIIL